MLTLLEALNVPAQNLDQILLNYRFYILNIEGEEEFLFGGSHIKCKFFGSDGNEGGWGGKLSWDRVFVFDNKLLANDSLTFLVNVSFYQFENINLINLIL